MALPGNNNSISLSQIQSEFGGSNPISLTEYYRNGTYVTTNNTDVPTSGEISMSNFFGAQNLLTLTISSDTQEVNLYSLAASAGWDESTPVLLTVNSGVYVWSDDTSVGGLVISSAFNGLLSINNYGYIIGRGGNGGYFGGSGGAGGPAIANSATGVILNNFSGAYIAGGGGGGGAHRGGGGGGAGGGRGGNGAGTTTGSGGAGGAIGQTGSNGGRATSGKKSEGSGGGAGGGGATGEDNGSSSLRFSGGGGGGRILGAGATGGDGGGWRCDR